MPTVSAGPSSRLAIEGGPRASERNIPLIDAKLDRADISAAMAVLESGMLRAGPKASAFEQAFARKTSAEHALACANGTVALQMAYMALLEPGDEVLVPAWTYIATASMLVASGLRPVFCECDPETYCIDADDAAKRVTQKTKAIAATHLYGNPADIEGVQAIATSLGLKVIYDAAQAHFATYKGQGLGAFGDGVTYSFYATKNLSTGEGGMVTCNDEQAARRMSLLRSHGETEKYLHEEVGFNFRMTDVEAAIGLSQMDRADDLLARRREIAARLDEAIAGIDGLHAPKTTPNAEHAYHLYQVRMDEGAFSRSRDEVCAALNAEGVGTGVHYPKPLHHQPAFREFAGASLPISERLSRTLFAVPVHPNLSDADVDAICEAITKVAAHSKR